MSGAVLLVALAGLAQADAGDLDLSFDGDGRRALNHGGSDVARAVMVRPDGKIVVAGYGGPGQDFIVSQLHPDGSLDTGFDGDGTAVADFGGDDQASAAALQPDGRILVAGTTSNAMSGGGMAVARFRPDGSLDASFDPGGTDGPGKKVFGIGDQRNAAALLVQPDGRILLVGARDGKSDSNFAITRLYPDGSVDGTSFADTDFDGSDSANAVALQPDGKIVVAGDTTPPSSPPRMAVARYNLNGTLDDTFGGTGKRTFGTGDFVSAKAVQVQPDGKIVVAGYGSDEIDFVVTRLNTDGTFDTAFGAAGTSVIDFALVELAHAAVLQPDGRIVVAGVAQPSLFDADFAAARLQPGGALDTTFGTDGKTTVPSGALEFAHAAALQPDGKIVLAGSTQVVTEDFVLARLEGVTPPAPGGGGVGPGVTPGGEAGADRTAPILSRFSSSPRRFRAGAAAKRPRRGTTLTLELSETASVRFDVLAVGTGRRVGARCRERTRANRNRRRCTLRTRRGGFFRSLDTGRSRLVFSGRLGTRALRPGRYSLRATPRDAAGNIGRSRAIAIRIVR